MPETWLSILIGTSGLTGILVVSFFIVYSQSDELIKRIEKEKLIILLLVTIASQCIHVAEEYATEFYLRFPAFFELAPWPASFFIWFNLTWVAIWCVSIIGFIKNIRIATVPIYFLAIVSMLNGIAHPIISIIHKGYFPGLISSFVVGFAGWKLLRDLLKK